MNDSVEKIKQKFIEYYGQNPSYEIFEIYEYEKFYLVRIKPVDYDDDTNKLFINPLILMKDSLSFFSFTTIIKNGMSFNNGNKIY